MDAAERVNGPVAHLDPGAAPCFEYERLSSGWPLPLLLLLATTVRASEQEWKQHTINGHSEFEAASVFDVDNDGKLDIVSGDTWYQAPDWKPYHVRDVARAGYLLP